jgi:WD40 repeat protein
MASESGEISLRNFWTGEEVQVLKGENLDNVYKVDFKNHIIAGSGQDRRLSIYNLKNNSHFHVLTDFLIYSVGLSPDGTLALFPYKQNNDMKLISTKDGSTLKIFTDLTATLNRIIFLNNHTVLTSSDENQIVEWIF